MLGNFLRLLRTSIFMLVILSVITGLLYPALITGIGQWLFKSQSNGSLTTKGSTLIGQSFTEPQYFWGRPSATMPYANNAASSSGSNLAPSNPALVEVIKKRIAALKKADPSNTAPIPVDLITASASGLDPDISVAAAHYQMARVARLRHLPLPVVKKLVATHIQPRQFGILGEARVNVLQLNVALDAMTSPKAHNQ